MQVPKTCVLPLDDAPSTNSYREALQRRLGNAWISMTIAPGTGWTHQASSKVTFCQQRHTHTPHPLYRTVRSDLVRHILQCTESVHGWPMMRHTSLTPGYIKARLTSCTTGKYRQTTASRSLKHAAPKPSISPDPRHCPRMLVSFWDTVNSNLSGSSLWQG
jgi:hypothetical protein